jgi:HD-like signal output (HDOD) protein
MPFADDADSAIDDIKPFDIDAAMVATISSTSIRLPPFSHVVSELQRVLARADFSVRDLVAAVQNEQGLVAAILSNANSARYAGMGEAATLPQAIARIGGQELFQLVVSLELGRSFASDGPLAGLRRIAWRDAVIAALLMQGLAGRAGIPRDKAFLCGLLHDVGKLVAITAIEDIIAAHDEARAMTLSDWQDVVERYHVELGIVAAARWELPALFADVIGHHHAPERAGALRPVVDVVAMADHVIAILARDPAPRVDLMQRILGVDDVLAGVILHVLERLPREVADLVGALPPPVRRTSSSHIAPTVAPPANGPRRNAHLTLHLKSGDLRYDVVDVRPNALVTRADPVVAISVLQRATVDIDGTVLEMCVTCDAHEQGPDGTRSVLRPFALPRELVAVWRRLTETPVAPDVAIAA